MFASSSCLDEPPQQESFHWEEDDGYKPVVMIAKDRIVPHDNDCLMGRGGKNNQHVGNEQLRCMARAVCDEYQHSSKKGKSQISRDLVRQVRELDPPGRFLKKNADTGEWEDVGDDVAREKASQVLRDAVAIHPQVGNQATSRVYLERPSLRERQRSTSAPSMLPSRSSARRRTADEAASERHDRQRLWSERQHESSEGHVDSSRTPFLPPVTPSSATAAKRRRYVRSTSDTWTSSYDRPSRQPQHHHPYEAYLQYQEHSSASSHRHHVASYPAQQLRTDPGTSSHMPSPHVSSFAEGPNEPLDFDLFNGELLESGDEGHGYSHRHVS